MMQRFVQDSLELSQYFSPGGSMHCKLSHYIPPQTPQVKTQIEPPMTPSPLNVEQTPSPLPIQQVNIFLLIMKHNTVYCLIDQMQQKRERGKVKKRFDLHSGLKTSLHCVEMYAFYFLSTYSRSLIFVQGGRAQPTVMSPPNNDSGDGNPRCS